MTSSIAERLEHVSLNNKKVVGAKPRTYIRCLPARTKVARGIQKVDYIAMFYYNL
jgi:hypothetical protein